MTLCLTFLGRGGIFLSQHCGWRTRPFVLERVAGGGGGSTIPPAFC